MIEILDLGFYLTDATAGPDWRSAGTFLVTDPGASLRPRDLLDALGRGAPLPSGHLLLATSGSTARDADALRLVALSTDAFLASARAVNAHLAVTPADVWAHALPLFHVGGLGILARAWLEGCRVVPTVGQRWDATRYHERVAASGATLSALVPSQVFDLVAAGLRSPASLRGIVVGGARLEPGLYNAARDLGWPCLPSYGMTETCSQVATAELPSAAGAAPGGNPYPEVLPVLSHASLRIGAGGRVHVRATSLLTCYVVVDRSTGTARIEDPKRDGWFETEDLGRLHGGGVEVLGRANEAVKVLGELVSLGAIESAVGRWLDGEPGWRERITDLAVVAMPHERRGAELVLALVPAAGLDWTEVQAGRFADALSDVLGPLERPSRLAVVDAIPRTALGKVRRGQLADSVGSSQ